jgi:hypothetical protein
LFKKVSVLVLLAAMSACATKQRSTGNEAPPPSKYLEAGDPVREDILKELTQYYDHMSARNWGAYASHFWPGATITTVWQAAGEPAPKVLITPIQDFIAQTAQGPDSKPIFEERMVDADVRVSNNLAQVWASYKARFGGLGKVDEWTGIDAFTLMKHDGHWKITGLTFAASEE